MIVIFGGTTEGRTAAEVCDRASKKFFYSTHGAEQKLHTTYAERVTGGMDAHQMVDFITRHHIKLIVDAAHPYAQLLHKNISVAAQQCQVPVVRFERLEQRVECDNAVYFNSLEEVVHYIKDKNLRDVLALTGVKSAAALSAIATSHSISLRIMDRELSNRAVERSGFPEERVIYYNLDSAGKTQNNIEICQSLNIKSIITKESGESGGFISKVECAKLLNIPLLIIKRPPLPHFSAAVYGQFGLRREVERLLPSFFELRTGFTTGSAATAASVAALKALAGVEGIERVSITLPNGELIDIEIYKTSVTTNHAECCVIKDGGDDPDATHKIEIVSQVRVLDDSPLKVDIIGGKGIGRVTLPGVGIKVGEAAINPVPREMIESNIIRVAKELNINAKIEVTIEVPQGEEVGAKTFNPRLGIMGGISILGTSGIVQPFSSEAFLESIKRQIDITKALGYNKIVINSGAMSERYIKSHTPELPQQCYIHYGNLIGATIELASREGVDKLCIGCMLGKAVKLANGAVDTHSKSSVIDREFIVKLATESQCSDSTKAKILQITTARELWNVVPREEYRLFDLIAKRCFDICKPLFPNGELEFLLISERGVVEVVIKNACG